MHLDMIIPELLRTPVPFNIRIPVVSWMPAHLDMGPPAVCWMTMRLDIVFGSGEHTHLQNLIPDFIVIHDRFICFDSQSNDQHCRE